MKIVFISNFFNHHQKYLSDSLYNITDKNYYFIATEQTPEEQLRLGYMQYEEPYVITYSDVNHTEIEKLIELADVVIVGSASQKLIENRIKDKKLIFRYSERFLKTGNRVITYPIHLYRKMRNNPIYANMYVLCASAYTSSDYSKYFLYKNKCFKWGYFPENKRYNVQELLNNKVKHEIMWCGRFIEWKHPDEAIRLAKLLKDNNILFRMKLVGTGPMESELHDMVRHYNLEEVEFLGAIQSDIVREYMEKSAIFITTSDYQEGWGAVLNEAMNSGCAVVASHAAGSTPYLIKDGINGYVFKCGDTMDLFRKVVYLLNNASVQEKIGIEAYNTISDTWNAGVAAQRFVDLCSELLKGNNPSHIFQDGPCSNAELIKNNWYNETNKEIE
jgi:glycosyltransferase involved in cell wall biosynthesis